MNNDIFDKIGISFEEMDKDQKGFLRGFITEYGKTVKNYNYPEAKYYFNMLISCLMIEFHKSYEHANITLAARDKSIKSILEKVFEYLSEEYKEDVKERKDGKKRSVYDYNEYGEYQGELIDSIADIFAITMIAGNSPPTYYSDDPVIKELIAEQKRNRRLLAKVQNFKSKLVKKEFSGKPATDENRKYICNKKEYYINCIIVLERLKTMVDPNATQLLKYYNEQLDIVKKSVPEKFFYMCDTKIKRSNELNLVDTTEKLDNLFDELNQIDDSELSIEEQRQLKKLVRPDDVKNVDYLKLAEDFTSRVNDKLDLEITLRQVISIFDNSENLKKMGITLDKDALKRKRTADGYVADFLYINTPFGRVEIQIQSQHENAEANYGYSAHNKMNNKALELYELPDLNDKEALKEFLTYVALVSPQKYFAQYDNTEENRILIQKFGQYQNYKSVASQFPKDSPQYEETKQYFSKLYSLRKLYFPNDDKLEKIEAISDFDIDDYINSDLLKRIVSGEFLRSQDEFEKEIKEMMEKEEKVTKTKSGDARD